MYITKFWQNKAKFRNDSNRASRTSRPFVIRKTLPIGQAYTPSGLEQAESRWLADLAVFAKHDIDPLSVPATAAVQIKENLEALDRRLERAERRCDTIIQQLEYRREVFAHRARQAAGNILKAVTVQAPCPTDQTTPDEILAEEVTIVPTTPEGEANVPSSEVTSAETAESTSPESAEQTTLDQIPSDEVTIVPATSAVETSPPDSEETSGEGVEPIPPSAA